jgi:predicted phosphodiesterase
MDTEAISTSANRVSMGICGGGAAWRENSEKLATISLKKLMGLMVNFFGHHEAVISTMSQSLRVFAGEVTIVKIRVDFHFTTVHVYGVKLSNLVIYIRFETATS